MRDGDGKFVRQHGGARRAGMSHALATRQVAAPVVLVLAAPMAVAGVLGIFHSGRALGDHPGSRDSEPEGTDQHQCED